MTGQNTSSAVMQQRSEPHDSLDDFPTPPWATRALCEFLQHGPPSETLGELTVREPAANRGHMVKPLGEYFKIVLASDVHDYGQGYPVRDYLWGPHEHITGTHWTITNPPFKLAEQFIERARSLSSRGVAMLVRLAFVEGIGRYERLFSVNPPDYILQFTERVVMHKGRLAPEGSTATAYCWLIWFTGGSDEHRAVTKFRWILPCRKRLEREGDYA